MRRLQQPARRRPRHALASLRRRPQHALAPLPFPARTNADIRAGGGRMDGWGERGQRERERRGGKRG
jgi:hypothetical protein